MKQQQKASCFRSLHQEATLVLPNVWDAISARMVEKAGAKALATTSAGISWSLGLPDGGSMTRELLCGVIRHIIRASDLPVSVDIERGYGDETPEDVALTVGMVLEAGAVGINLEDAKGPDGATLRSPDAQALCIASARQKAIQMGNDLFINARIDVYMVNSSLSAQEKIREVGARSAVYVAAGADGVFVPGVTELDTVRQLVEQVDVPLNIMIGSGAPSQVELAEAGVKRISTGPALTLGVAGYLAATTAALLRSGTLQAPGTDVTFMEMNAWE